MTRTAAILGGVVLTLLAHAWCAPAARADDYQEVLLDRRTGSSSAFRVRARVLATPAGDRASGYGYVRIELVNPTEQAYDVGITLQPAMGYGATNCEFRKSHRLEATTAGRPFASAVLELPLLNARWGMTARFTLDGRLVPEQLHLQSGSGRRGTSFSALLVKSGEGEAGSWARWLESETGKLARRGNSRLALSARTPAQLPGSWTLLSGFDLVIVDHAAEGLTPERQQTLARYVAGGGNLVVTNMGSAAEGPLAKMCREHEATEEGPHAAGHHGLGRWIAFQGSADAESWHVREWLNAGSKGAGSVLQRVQETHAGGIPSALWLPLAIPGLGEVPTGVFFFLILLFVVVVGPVSYVYFRRRRRLAMLLVTIPVAGFVCTAVILGYGLFSEGFGVIGSVRSFTVLDQANHLAASSSGRTLYAGLQPRSLDPAANTFVACASFTPEDRSRNTRSVLHVDLDAGHRMSGGILPSRAPTPFVATTVGRSRARLRFRRRPDGGFDVLSVPGYAPVDEPGAVLLHTPEGAYYRTGAAGHLEPIPSERDGLVKRVSSVVQSLSSMPIGAGEVLSEDPWGGRMRYYSRREVQNVALRSTPMDVWIAERARTLPPGSYLARVKRPPLPEELGLDVDYRSQEHVVLGLLGPEDVIDE